MKTYIFLIAGFVFLLSGCQKTELTVYGTDNYIQFSNLVKDSVTFPFLFYPGEDEVLFPVPVELAGQSLSANMAYKLVVDEKYSTAIAGFHFDLPDNIVFHAGKYKDTCLIKLIRTPDLKTTEVKLVLRLEGNENFKLGQQDYSMMIIRINDRLVKPEWWNNRVTTYYLGNYSDLKYELFIQETGVADFTGKSESELRTYALKFKYYLQKEKQAGRVVKEKDGKEMEVKVLG